MSEHTCPVPPSRYAYTGYKCRCDECRYANRLYQRDASARRAARLADEFDRLPHGSTSTYINWGCRCIPCADAQSVANAVAAGLRKYAGAES